MNKKVFSASPARSPLKWCASISRLRASAPAIGAYSALLLGGMHTAQAANDAWSTMPPGNTFTGNDWTTGTTTPGAATGTIAAGDSLYFGTSNNTTLNDDEAASFSLAGFTFNTGASAFTIAGNSITLTGNITNSSSVLQTINDALTISSATGFTTTTGNLTLGGAITGTGLNGNVLAGGGGTVTLGGTNSFTTSGGGGLSLQVNGGSTLAITGTTGVAFGTAGDYFAVGQGSSVGTVTVAAGANLNVTGTGNFIVGTFTGGTLNVNGTATFAAGSPLRLAYNGQSVVNLNSGGTIATAAAISNESSNSSTTAAFNFNGGTLKANAAVTLLGGGASFTTVTTSSTSSTIDANGFGATVALPIVNGATTGGLTIIDSSGTNAGSVILSSTNTYTGGTIVNSGTLQLNTGGGAGAVRGVLTVNAGATLLLNSGNALGYAGGTQVTTLNITGGTVNTTSGEGNEGYITSFNLTGGTLAYGGTSSTNNSYQIAAGDNTAPGITSNASPNLSLISGGINIRSGTLGIAVASGTTTNGVDLQISGPITSGGTYGLNKTGAGNLLLSADNTYTGGTTVSGGTLTLNAGSANGAVIDAVTVNSGTTLNLAHADALGYGSGTSVTALNVSGTVNNTSGSNEGYYAAFNLTGGTMTSTGGSYIINDAAVGITSNASATTSVISGTFVAETAGSNLVFTTAPGSTASGTDLQISGVISAQSTNIGITKAGTGTLLLTAANTYTGTTVVNAGMLTVGSGGKLGTGAITVNSGGTLMTSGTGTLGGGTSVTVAGTGALTLGNSVSFTSAQTLTFAEASTINLNSTNNTLATIIDSNNTSYALAAGTYTAPALNADFESGGDVVNTFTGSGTLTIVSPVPEPATWIYGFLMVGTVGMSQRRTINGWLRLARG